MTQTSKIIKNSFLLITQQILLNILSIFAVGYIARVLGQHDYGKFIFAFNFIGLFIPLTSLGVASVATRELTEHRTEVNEVFGKLLLFRLVASIVVLGIVIVVVNIIGYPAETKTLVYFAGLTLVTTAFVNTSYSVFQSFERVEFVAFTMFISGFVLTLLSILVAWLGLGVLGVTIAYVLGNLVAVGVVLMYLARLRVVPVLSFDTQYYRRTLHRAKHFFFPDMSNMIGRKIGIVFLSKISGDVFVGMYGAAFTLVERLLILPDSICTSLFPVMIRTYRQSKDELITVFERFYRYLVVLGLPLAVGITIMAVPIMRLIYGERYTNAAVILAVLSWWLLFSFLNYIQNYVMAAMHKEKQVAISSYIANLIYLVIGVWLISRYQGLGAAIALLFSVTIGFFITAYNVRKYLKTAFLKPSLLGKILLSNILLALCLFFLRTQNIFIGVVVGCAVYIAAVTVMGVLKLSEFIELFRTYFKR